MIDITRNTKAVLRHVSKDETRLNLCAVHFNAGIQVATNGHTMAILGTEYPTDPAEFPAWDGFQATANGEPVTLQAADVEDVLKALPKAVVPICEHALEGTGRNGTVKVGVATHMGRKRTDSPRTFEFKPIEGAFPDFTQVIPKANATPLHIGIDPAYLCSVGESMRDIGATCVEFQVGKPTSPMRFIGRGKDGAQLCVIVMPMRMA